MVIWHRESTYFNLSAVLRRTWTVFPDEHEVGAAGFQPTLKVEKEILEKGLKGNLIVESCPQVSKDRRCGLVGMSLNKQR